MLPKVTTRPASSVTPSAASWTDLPGFPTAIMDNGVAVNEGKVYSIGGTDGASVFASGFAYDPVGGQWNPIAGMSWAREVPEVAAIGGRLYVVGGWAAPAIRYLVWRSTTRCPTTGRPGQYAGTARGRQGRRPQWTDVCGRWL